MDIGKFINSLWSTVPVWVNYITIDFDGHINGFNERPIAHQDCSCGVWGIGDENGVNYPHFILKLYTEFAEWHKLIFERPDEHPIAPIDKLISIYWSLKGLTNVKWICVNRNGYINAFNTKPNPNKFNGIWECENRGHSILNGRIMLKNANGMVRFWDEMIFERPSECLDIKTIIKTLWAYFPPSTQIIEIDNIGIVRDLSNDFLIMYLNYDFKQTRIFKRPMKNL